MVRLRRPPEWGVEPVPDSLRVLRTFDLFVLWSSLGAGLLVFAAGALLVQLFGLTLWEAFLVSLVGSVLGSVLLAAAGHHGSQAGVPTMVSLRPILGRSGSYAPTVLNIVQLLGWTAFDLLVAVDLRLRSVRAGSEGRRRGHHPRLHRREHLLLRPRCGLGLLRRHRVRDRRFESLRLPDYPGRPRPRPSPVDRDPGR